MPNEQAERLARLIPLCRALVLLFLNEDTLEERLDELDAEDLARWDASMPCGIDDMTRVINAEAGRDYYKCEYDNLRQERDALREVVERLQTKLLVATKALADIRQVAPDTEASKIAGQAICVTGNYRDLVVAALDKLKEADSQ